MKNATHRFSPKRSERIRVRIRVRYGLSAADREGFAENVSEGGIYINTNQVFKVGSRLLLRIEFLERVVRQRGEVVWAIQVPEHLRGSMVCGMGISFTDTDPEWLSFFRRWKAALLDPG